MDQLYTCLTNLDTPETFSKEIDVDIIRTKATSELRA